MMLAVLRSVQAPQSAAVRTEAGPARHGAVTDGTVTHSGRQCAKRCAKSGQGSDFRPWP
jgi:hypothetical protein